MGIRAMDTSTDPDRAWLLEEPSQGPYADHKPPEFDVPNQEPPESDEKWSRWAELGPFLDGTVIRPQPTAGGERDDAIQLLYHKRWHTVIGLTTCGKTTFALWHIKAALDAGEHVIYLHFEETDPGGVLERLQGLGVDQDAITKQFHWANCDKAWAAGEMAYRITQLEQPPALAVLDGINAACSQHGWKVGDTEAIGSYRAMFVTPLVKAGAAVLSLGHPPKAKDRHEAPPEAWRHRL